MRPDDLVLVNGGSGVTGALLVGLAAARGAEVIATAGPASHERLRRLGAAHVLDYHDPDWPEQALAIGGGLGVTAVANAVPQRLRRRDRHRARRRSPRDDHPGPTGRAAGHRDLVGDRAARRPRARRARRAARGRRSSRSRSRRRSRSRKPLDGLRGTQPRAAPAERSCFAPDRGENLAPPGTEWRPPLVNDRPRDRAARSLAKGRFGREAAVPSLAGARSGARSRNGIVERNARSCSRWRESPT